MKKVPKIIAQVKPQLDELANKSLSENHLHGLRAGLFRLAFVAERIMELGYTHLSAPWPNEKSLAFGYMPEFPDRL